MRVRVPEGVSVNSARLLVAGKDATIGQKNRWVTFEVPKVTDHEVVVLG